LESFIDHLSLALWAFSTNNFILHGAAHHQLQLESRSRSFDLGVISKMQLATVGAETETETLKEGERDDSQM